MKRYSILKVILLVLLCVCVCTWIFSTIEYNGELTKGSMNQVGFFDLFAYLVEVVRYFPYVALMTLSIGAFYGVAYRIPAYRELLDKLVKNFKGKENIFLVATIIIISGVVSITGMTFGILFVFPLIISLVLLMGYNKLVAASVTVGSYIVGLLGTTLATGTMYYANYILGTTYSNEMITKVILLVVGIVVLAYNVIVYAKKVKNDTDRVLEFVPAGASLNIIPTVKPEIKKEEKVSKKDKDVSKKKEIKKETKVTKKVSTKSSIKKSSKTRASDLTSSDVKVVKTPRKVKVWPFVLVFDLAFIILVIATFDWAGILSAKWPVESLKAVKDFTVCGFEIFGKLLGSSFNKEFGLWDMNYQIPGFIILMTMLLGFIYGLKLDKFFEGMLDGIRRASKPVFYMMLAYLVLIVATYHPFQLHITEFFLGFTKNLNVITMTIVAMFSSLFNIESAYVAQSTLPYVTSVITDTTLYPIISVIFQAVYGLMMLVAPTSIILIGTLSYLDIPYLQWLKHIWKLFLELLLVIIVMFLVLIII